MLDPYRRIDSNMHPVNFWFKVAIPARLLNQGETSEDKLATYNGFGAWFIDECNGVWAFPGPTDIYFSDEEDRVKFILRWL